MYNKIASIILNSGKNHNYAGEVFVSQPDANKERLAGKIFVIAEIEGRKSDTQKIINFLVNIFDYNYYGDEKILLRDKIEGLGIENIFETVLARVNQGLVDFLHEERLKINPASTNLTLGVIHEDKLYFSNYGKNKAFLVYRRKGDYEILNIESNVTDEETENLDIESEPSGSKIFSAIINGEIPPYSYFLFTNEALPEYLSNRELVNIITKLPPMVAAEQIKNFLQKINSFAPFLGIIVKSTIGSKLSETREANDEIEPVRAAAETTIGRRGSRNAHNSISHLNYTEQRTESMLAPAGIINLKKVIKGAGELINKLKARTPDDRRIVKFYEETEETMITTAPQRESKRPDLARRESFMLKERLVFKKKNHNIWPKTISILRGVGLIFVPRFWAGVYQGVKSWIKSLGKKDKMLIGTLAACFLILIVSIIFTAAGKKTRLATEQFDNAVADINNKQTQVDSYLLYNNQSGATSVLNEALALLNSSLPQNKEQEAKKAELYAKVSGQRDKIQKITEISNFQEIINTTAWNAQAGADNLVFLDNRLYIGDGVNKAIYNLSLKDSARGQIAIAESGPLSSPSINDSIIYYLSGQKVIKISGQNATSLNIGPEMLQGENFIQVYNGSLYLLSKADNQIYKYKSSSSGFSGRSNWLKPATNLALASDFKIDGKVTVSQSEGDLLKFNKGQKIDYATSAIDPSIRADKILMTADNIYILDLKGSRIIVLNKNGALVKQFRVVKEGLKDFAIDEGGKSVYILAGTTVYKFGL